LRSHLKLDLISGANRIRISYSSNVPIETAEIVNSIADRYKTMRDVEEDQRNNRGEEALRSQIAEQEKVVSDAREVVDRAMFDLNGPHTDVEKMKQDLLAAQEDRDARQVLLDRTSKPPEDQSVEAWGGLNQQQPNFATMRTKILDVENQIAERLKSGATEKDPHVVALRTELQVLNRQDVEYVDGLKRAMQIDLEMSKKRVALLQEKVDAAKARLDQNPQLKAYRDALRDLNQQQSLLDVFNLRLNQMIADGLLMQSPVRILVRADAPSYPIEPNVPLDLFASILAGGLLSVTVASFVELLRWLRR
jgi:uncharacterized protein involved in exopolysaccharide biosynthesis